MHTKVTPMVLQINITKKAYQTSELGIKNKGNHARNFTPGAKKRETKKDEEIGDWKLCMCTQQNAPLTPFILTHNTPKTNSY